MNLDKLICLNSAVFVKLFFYVTLLEPLATKYQKNPLLFGKLMNSYMRHHLYYL